MHTYIGTKIVTAEPMDEATFTQTVRGAAFPIESKARAGYLVVYEDGYRSWSPKETFERAYRLVTPGEMKLIVSGQAERLRP